MWLLDGTLKNTFNPHADYVMALVAARPRTRSRALHATVKLFNVNDGAVLRTFTHLARGVYLAMLPDGLRFVSGSDDGTASSSSGLAPLVA